MKYIPLKYIKEDPAVGNADSSEDARESTGMLERLVSDLRGQLAELSPGAETLRRAGVSPADYAADQPNARLVAFAERRAIPILDARPVLAAHQQEKIYWDGDGEHWEVRGHEVMAEATADFLAGRGLLGAAVAAAPAAQ